MPSELSIYTCRRGSGVAVLAVYVDDIAVFASAGTVAGVKAELMGLFEMRNLRELQDFLGMQVTRVLWMLVMR